MGCTQSDSAYQRSKGLNAIPSGNVQRRKSQLQRRQSSSNNYKLEDDGSMSITLGNAPKLAAPQQQQQQQRRQSTAPHSSSSTSTRRVSEVDPADKRRQSDGESLNRRQSERKMSMGNPTKCKRCGESVGKTEEAKDSKGQVFHIACLKCGVCGLKLHAKESVSLSATRMTSSQYVQDGRDLYCHQHAPTVENARRKNSIKGQDITEKAVDSKELLKVSSSRRDLNKEAKEVLEESGGFASEIKCGRCGHAIEKTQKMTVSGMMRYHEVCPSKEELAKADKSVKSFLEKLPDRLAAVLTCDAKTKKPHTFLYERDNVSYRDALKAATGNQTRQVSVTFLSDTTARDQIPKNFVIPTERAFDLQVKGYSLVQLSFENAWDISKKLTPSLDGTKLRVIKMGSANGIVQTLEGHFQYDENNAATPLLADRLVLVFERMGPDEPSPIGRPSMKMDDVASIKSRQSMSRGNDSQEEPSSPMLKTRDAQALVESTSDMQTLARPKAKATMQRFDSSSTGSNGSILKTTTSSLRLDVNKPLPKTPPSSGPSPRTPVSAGVSPRPPVPSGKPQTPLLPKNKPQIQPIDMDMV